MGNATDGDLSESLTSALIGNYQTIAGVEQSSTAQTASEPKFSPTCTTYPSRVVVAAESQPVHQGSTAENAIDKVAGKDTQMDEGADKKIPPCDTSNKANGSESVSESVHIPNPPGPLHPVEAASADGDSKNHVLGFDSKEPFQQSHPEALDELSHGNDKDSEESSSVHISSDADDDDLSADEESVLGNSGDDEGNRNESKHPFIGVLVRINRGKESGITGRIKSIKARGWWTIDHPELAGRVVHSARCTLLEPVTEEEMRVYFRKNGRDFKMSPLLISQLRGTDRGRDLRSRVPAMMPYVHSKRTPTNTGEPRQKRMKVSSDLPPPFATKPADPKSCVRMSSLAQSARDTLNRRIRQVSLSDDCNLPSNILCEKPDMLKYRQGGPRHCRSLPPIMFESSNTYQLPASLSHLDPDFKVDIFNRRTGKVMTGANAVKVKDLPELLMAHAEYEPIVPPPPFSLARCSSQPQPIVIREGRSSANIRVSANVQPQERLRGSSYEGKAVVLTTGPYEGMTGTIQTYIPGGWYVLKGVGPDRRGLPLIVSPSEVELLPEPIPDEIDESPGAVTFKPRHRALNGADNKALVASFQGFLSEFFSSPIRMLRDRLAALDKEEKTLEAALLGVGHIDQYGMQGDLSEGDRRRLQARLEYVSLSKEKIQSELDEQKRSSAGARIHAFNAFESISREESAVLARSAKEAAAKAAPKG